MLVFLLNIKRQRAMSIAQLAKAEQEAQTRSNPQLSSPL